MSTRLREPNGALVRLALSAIEHAAVIETAHLTNAEAEIVLLSAARAISDLGIARSKEANAETFPKHAPKWISRSTSAGVTWAIVGCTCGWLVRAPVAGWIPIDSDTQLSLHVAEARFLEGT